MPTLANDETRALVTKTLKSGCRHVSEIQCRYREQIVVQISFALVVHLLYILKLTQTAILVQYYWPAYFLIVWKSS
jgi:hypothetical protein